MPNFSSNTTPKNLNVRTLSVYRLNDAGIPIELVTDLQVGKSANRVTLDLIESESYNVGYSVTQNALQDFSDATSNVHKELRTLSVSGVLTSIEQMQITVAPPFSSIPTQNEERLDLVRFQNLQVLANQRRPVGVYTPRFALPVAFITSISSSWAPDLSQNLRVSLSFTEARIVSPFQNESVPDFTAMIAGNNTKNSGGQNGASEYLGDVNNLLDSIAISI